MSSDKTDVQSIEQQLSSVNLSELSPLPDFINQRIILWDKFKERYLNELSSKTNSTISVSAKDKNGDNKVVEGLSWKTSPSDIAKQLGPKSWTDSLVIAKVNGVLWDLERPLEENCSLELLSFNDDEGLNQLFVNCLIVYQ
jgi:threonyl-tRNA synthetase